GWLDVSPDNGSSTGQADLISVIYSVGNLPIWVHLATITIPDPAAANSPRETDVTIEVKTVLPDFDKDGDVDQADFGELQRCYSGPGVPVVPGCEHTDLDDDLDADQDDAGILQGCRSGPLQLADKTCDDPYE
ncbi:MAG: hypothetical protein GY773_01160, partial [Actinomycetia bacterium]|nr:hypothetical protein [Actinomycetes bacterium]